MEHVIRHAIPMIVVKGSPNKGIIIVHDASLIPRSAVASGFHIFGPCVAEADVILAAIAIN